jgi:F-type H+-transporting ATPase subunit epsilon
MSSENYMQLDVVTPEKAVLSRMVEEVIAPGSAGEFGVLIGHTPFLTSLKPGQLIAKAEDGDIYMAVGGGFAEIIKDRVIILAETAVMAQDIDGEATKHELEQAEQKLKTLSKDDPDYFKWEDKQRKAEVVLRVLENYQKK